MHIDELLVWKRRFVPVFKALGFTWTHDRDLPFIFMIRADGWRVETSEQAWWASGSDAGSHPGRDITGSGSTPEEAMRDLYLQFRDRVVQCHEACAAALKADEKEIKKIMKS